MSADDQIQGGLPPPPGITPNFENPPSIRTAVHGVNIVLIITISLTTFARLFTRFRILKEHSWADYTMIVAYCCFVVYFTLIEEALQHGGGTHQWDVPQSELLDFAYWAWITEVFYCACVASVRLTLCIQLMNIFNVGRSKWFWTATAFVCINMVYYLVQFFFTLFQCRPISKSWQPSKEGSCMSSGFQHFLIATSVFNLIGDILMLVYPLYTIRGLQMSFKRRIAVTGLFTVGLLTIIASILRLMYSLLNNGSKDLTYTLTQVGECTVGEIAAGILVGNLIVLPRFIKVVGAKARLLIASNQRKEPGTVRLGNVTPSSGISAETAKSLNIESSTLRLSDERHY